MEEREREGRGEWGREDWGTGGKGEQEMGSEGV